MIQTEYFNQVMRYLDNQMSKEEASHFEHQLASNTSLAEEYEVHKEANVYLENKKLMEFNDKLQEIERLYPVQKNSKIIWYRAAAVVLLLCVGTIVFTYFFSDPSNEDIFKAYYSSSASNMVVRSADDSNNLLEVGIEAYDKKNYKEAIQILEQVKTDNKEYISAYFYMALSYVEEQKYQDAIEYFEQLEMRAAHIYTDQVKWYLSLCYIVTDQRDKSIPLLTSLVDEGMAYESKAAELLDKLE